MIQPACADGWRSYRAFSSTRQSSPPSPSGAAGGERRPRTDAQRKDALLAALLQAREDDLAAHTDAIRREAANSTEALAQWLDALAGFGAAAASERPRYANNTLALPGRHSVLEPLPIEED